MGSYGTVAVEPSDDQGARSDDQGSTVMPSFDLFLRLVSSPQGKRDGGEGFLLAFMLTQSIQA